MVSESLRKMVCRRTEGQSLVEVGLTLPLFAVLLLGGAELARLAYASIEVTNAAKAAVQYGAQSTGTSQDATGMQSAASDETTDLVSSVTATPKLSLVCSDGTVPSDSAGPTWSNQDCSTSEIEWVLTVNTSATFDPLIHAPGLPSSYTLHGNAVQQVLSY